MKIKNMHWIIIGVLIALVSITLTGCGKNLMGPVSAGEGIQLGDSGGDSAIGSDEQAVNALCTERDKRTKPWYLNVCLKYLHDLNEWFVQHLTKALVDKFFQDPALNKSMNKLLTSEVFRIVVFRCGVGRLLFAKALKIITESWQPGLNTNPKNFNYEVTLLPLRFDFNHGFYGAVFPGWLQTNHGYFLEAVTPENDRVSMEASSQVTDIFQNQYPAASIRWNYIYSPHEYVPGNNVPAAMRFSIINAIWDKQFIVDEFLIYEENSRTFLQDIWFSTANKSSHCKIITMGSDALNMDLTFDVNGAGGGYVRVQNCKNTVDEYEFTVYANGHGYYIKNGGRKYRF